MKRSRTTAQMDRGPEMEKQPAAGTEYTGIRCIASANTNQGDATLFKGTGRHFTAMSTCAIIQSVVNEHSTFSKEEFDFVLKSGDNLYVALEPYITHHSKYLCADEIPTDICVGQNLVTIKNVNDNYLTSGMYPDGHHDIDIKIVELKNNLDENVFNDNYVDARDGVMFTGAEATVAFWRHNGKYYLFNSHAVNEKNKTVSYGVARLFELYSTKSLAKSLLEYNIAFKQQYSMSKIEVVSVLPLNMNVDDVRLSDATQCSIIISSATIDTPPEVRIGKTINLAQSMTQCSESLVSLKVRDSPSILLNKNNSTSSTSKRSETEVTVSQKSKNSESVLNGYVSSVSKIKVFSVMPLNTNLDDVRSSDATQCNTIDSDTINSPAEACNGKATNIISQSLTQCNESFINFVSSNNETKTTDSQKSVISETILNEIDLPIIPKQTYTEVIKKPVVMIEKVKDFKLSLLKPVVVIESLESLAIKNTKPLVKRGRPIKRKRGPTATKTNAHLDAVMKYTEKNPDVHRQSVQNYNESNPDVHRQSVQKYNESNPDVHRQSVQKYNESNPDVHRQSAQKYSEKHPDVNKEATARYNKVSRNVDIPLRRSKNLIGEKRGDELNAVKAFVLKKPSLRSPDTYVCRHCGARLFEEEKTRTMWCCRQNHSNVQNFTPLTEEFYDHEAFLARPRAYNNLFAFSALGVTHGYQHVQQGLSFIKIQGRTYHRVFDLACDQSTNNIGLYISDFSERENIAQNRSLNLEVTRCITNYLHNVNPFIECFKRLNLETSDEAFIQFERTTRATHGNILGDQPVGREVSAIINTDRELFIPKCIALWKVGDRKPHTVDIMHPLYESFQYPLLYPEGNAGWCPEKLGNDGIKLTQARYVRCLLLAEDRFSKFSRLSEEWMVDM